MTSPTTINTAHVSSHSATSGRAVKDTPSFLSALIYKVALMTFNVFTFWTSPTTWTIGFCLGIIFKEEIKVRISDLFSKIMSTHLAWQVVIPIAFAINCLALPVMFMMQSGIAGADLGSRLALRAECSSSIVDFLCK